MPTEEMVTLPDRHRAEPGRRHDVDGGHDVDDEQFGSIRVGVSTLLMRRALTDSLRPALVTDLGWPKHHRTKSAS